MSEILIVEDDTAVRKTLAAALTDSGHEVTQAATVEEAQTALGGELFDLVITDLKLPDGDGLAVLETLARQRLRTAVVVVTAFGSVDLAVRAMHAGAFDFLEKPVGIDRLMVTVERALEHSRLSAELRRRSERPLRSIIGDSRPMQDLRHRIRQAAQARVVLVTGETGTGKNLVAAAIHAERDPTSPFVMIHCGMLPATMIDSELYGHVQAAYPGADFRRGLLREADGGTVFFDEITTVPLELQPKLLRFFEAGEIRPGGADRTIHVDCQAVVATASDLAAEVAAGRLREDLLYRLDVFRHRPAPAPRAPRGHPEAGEPPRGPARDAPAPDHASPGSGSDRAAAEPRLAGQRPRARACDRARDPVVGRRRADRRRLRRAGCSAGSQRRR